MIYLIEDTLIPQTHIYWELPKYDTYIESNYNMPATLYHRVPYTTFFFDTLKYALGGVV